MSPDDQAIEWIARHEDFIRGRAGGNEDAAQEARAEILAKFREGQPRSDSYLRSAVIKQVTEVRNGRPMRWTRAEGDSARRYDPQTSRGAVGVFSMDSAPGYAETFSSPFDGVAEVDSRLALEDLVKGLGPEDQVNALGRAHGWTTKEIGAAIGKTVSQVNKRWRELREELASRVPEQDRLKVEPMDSGVAFRRARPGVNNQGLYRVKFASDGTWHWGGEFRTIKEANERAREMRAQLQKGEAA